MNRNESPNISQGLTTKDETRGTKREFEEEEDADSDDSIPKNEKRSGRRKIKIEYIDDKNRRHITFSKRKAGIMKKAYELSTLTGTQVLLLVVSETGLVYTFTTPKLQPLVTQPEGKNLIQSCLNAPDSAPSKDTAESTTQPTQQTTVIPQSAQPQGPISTQIPSPKLQRQQAQQPQSLPSQVQSQQTPPGYGGDTSSGVDANSGSLYGNDRQVWATIFLIISGIC
ncbi:transcription factor of the MADS box [Basidiobolus ranarum]|uniref:Transcription factor of the MADS box n=1 Tax=Basidiobolus ranarum TaxID=34480 RepID=A0ABR2X1U1_9FUNG